MKKVVCALILAVLLCGCSDSDAQLDRAMNLRAELIAGEVQFDCEVTADYGNKTYTFSMECQADTGGNVTFTVVKPESIAGISGAVAADGGKLTFDGTALAFELMADGQLTPVSAPWVLMKTLRSGYLTSCTQEGQILRLSIDDSYEEDALHLDIWLNENDLPDGAEVYWQGRRLLTIDVNNFEIV